MVTSMNKVKLKKCISCTESIYRIKIDLDVINSLIDQFVMLKYQTDVRGHWTLESKSTIYFDNTNYCYEHLAKLVNIDDFALWTHKYKFSKIYSLYFQDLDCYSADELYFSTLEYFQLNEIALDEMNSEVRWFMEPDHYCGIPLDLKQKLIIQRYIGNTHDQGKMNGPDFIFKNLETRETAGLEVFELNPTIFKFDSEIRDPEKVIRNIDKQINQIRGGNIENNLKTLNKEIYRKIEKWDKYVKTNKKYIGVILNNSLFDEIYFIMICHIKGNEFISSQIDDIFFL
jgi:hypothetical protein